jgi:hypothetical protein
MESDKQDRAEEIEALEAIFGEDFTLVAEDTFEFQIGIAIIPTDQKACQRS